MPSALYVSRSSLATDMICSQNLPDVICFLPTLVWNPEVLRDQTFQTRPCALAATIWQRFDFIIHNSCLYCLLNVVHGKIQPHVQAAAENAPEYNNMNEVNLFLYWYMFDSLKTCAKLQCSFFRCTESGWSPTYVLQWGKSILQKISRSHPRHTLVCRDSSIYTFLCLLVIFTINNAPDFGVSGGTQCIFTILTLWRLQYVHFSIYYVHISRCEWFVDDCFCVGNSPHRRRKTSPRSKILHSYEACHLQGWSWSTSSDSRGKWMIVHMYICM